MHGGFEWSSLSAAHAAWKMLIEFCYSAHKGPLEKVYIGIDLIRGLGKWNSGWLLYISKIVPTHDVQHADDVIIPDTRCTEKCRRQIRTRAVHPGLCTPDYLGRPEIGDEDEQKMMEEVIAHLNATLGLIARRGDHYFEDN